MKASARCNMLDMRLLVAARCDCNARAQDGTTALMEAAAMGFLECVTFLLENRADINLVNKVSLSQKLANFLDIQTIKHKQH
jgi:ankyrin repeat protein